MMSNPKPSQAEAKALGTNIEPEEIASPFVRVQTGQRL